MKKLILTFTLILLCAFTTHANFEPNIEFTESLAFLGKLIGSLSLEGQQDLERKVISRGQPKEMLAFWQAVKLLPAENQRALFETKIPYTVTNDPIDVVIPCHVKDKKILEFCIAGVKRHCTNIRRIIVVSATKLTDHAEWCDEAQFPFNKRTVALCLNRGDVIATEEYLNSITCTAGWYYQQLLKLYAPLFINGISSKVLVLDADTVFLNPVSFESDAGESLFNYFKNDSVPSYIEHAQRMLPFMRPCFENGSCVTHHMLFNRAVLTDLFSYVEATHSEPFWEAFCHAVEPKTIKDLWSGASEYQIYFNFIFTRSDKVKRRMLKASNTLAELTQGRLDALAAENYQVASFHNPLDVRSLLEKQTTP